MKTADLIAIDVHTHAEVSCWNPFDNYGEEYDRAADKYFMRYALIALSILLGTATPAMAQVSVGIAIPGVSIGINLPVYPELVLVPGYPVYYAPRVQANYFFYDGLYWVYQHDNWYVSSWYNGPWDLVAPDDVPLFLLRVPVRYYLAPPVYFYGWVVTAPPRWDLYWGPRWVEHHHGWDRWDRRVIHAPAPLPVYQRHYSGDRYPRADYQHVIRREHYRYEPRDALAACTGSDHGIFHFSQHSHIASFQSYYLPDWRKKRNVCRCAIHHFGSRIYHHSLPIRHTACLVVC